MTRKRAGLPFIATRHPQAQICNTQENREGGNAQHRTDRFTVFHAHHRAKEGKGKTSRNEQHAAAQVGPHRVIGQRQADHHVVGQDLSLVDGMAQRLMDRVALSGIEIADQPHNPDDRPEQYGGDKDLFGHLWLLLANSCGGIAAV